MTPDGASEGLSLPTGPPSRAALRSKARMGKGDTSPQGPALPHGREQGRGRSLSESILS